MSRLTWFFVIGLAVLISGCMPKSRLPLSSEQNQNNPSKAVFSALFQSNIYSLEELPKDKKSCRIVRNQDLGSDVFLVELEAQGLGVQIEIFSFAGPRRLRVLSSSSPLDWTFRVNAKHQGKDYVMSWRSAKSTTCEGELKKAFADTYELSLDCKNLESQKQVSENEVEFFYADLLKLKLVCKL